MVETGERVHITSLAANGRPIPAVVSHISGRGLRLVASSPVSPGHPVQVALQNGILLGECQFCSPSADHHIVGLEIEQALLHLDSLANLVANLVGATPQLPVARS